VPSDERIIRLRDDEVNVVRAVVRVLGVIVLCAFVLCIVACESRAHKLFAEAEKQVDAGDLDSAVRIYTEITEKYPESPEAARANEAIRLYQGLSSAIDYYGARKVYDLMIATARHVYRYRNRSGRFPTALAQLTPRYLDQPPMDPWGRELLYVTKPRRRGYVLACFGSDGQRGGEGEARDWFIEDGRFVSRPSVDLP